MVFTPLMLRHGFLQGNTSGIIYDVAMNTPRPHTTNRSGPFYEATLIGAGVALGAVVRYVVVTAGMVLTPATEMQLTLICNVIGCVMMGLFKPGPFLGTGFLGGLTTFSAFALASAQSTALDAVIYTATTSILCVGGWLLGDRLARSQGSGKAA